MDIAHSLNTALAGRYVIESEIGRGGMATVYRARDVRHDRHVALKLLNPDLGAVLGAERFLSEIREGEADRRSAPHGRGNELARGACGADGGTAVNSRDIERRT